MAKASRRVKHPYVVSRKDYCGGSPIIKGTKFPVRAVVNYILKQGITPEELVKEFSHLTLAQVYDALSYYYDHEEDIERELQEYTEAKLRP
ncbi:MAG: hypothetical protein KatS3mg131_2234 [Candidatus Tectimicrobiota bacterium]|nr:MAG: hypothetical protein KatS3mg131_2234 [Candidatus Tectomicrobia bacterium]